MEVKSLVAGVEYATCDGMLVVPVTPVHSKWVTRVADAKGARLNPRVIEEDLDPWGPCHRPGNASQFILSATSRHVVHGVRVRRYGFDPKGRRVGDGYDVVVRSAEIKGLWSDYLIGHGEVVKQKADSEALNQRQRELQQMANDTLAGTSWSARIQIHDPAFRRVKVPTVAWTISRSDHFDGTGEDTLLAKLKELTK